MANWLPITAPTPSLAEGHTARQTPPRTPPRRPTFREDIARGTRRRIPASAIAEMRALIAGLDERAASRRNVRRVAFEYDPTPAHTLRDELDEKVDRVLHNALSENTHRSYADQQRWYLEWCAEHGRDPHKRATLREHLIALALTNPGSVRSRYFAARRLTGLGDSELHGLMNRLRRGYKPTPRSSVAIELLEQLVARIDRLSSPRRERDRVVLLVSYFGALRRSELRQLDWSDIVVEEERVRLRIERSKTSIHPETVYLPARHDTLCPRAAIVAWSTFVNEGPFIRTLHKSGKVLLHRGAPVARNSTLILKEHIAAIGGDPAGLASHGLRIGGLTALHVAGASDEEKRRHARHARERSLSRYIRADGPDDFSEALGI
jgi:integrase